MGLALALAAVDRAHAQTTQTLFAEKDSFLTSNNRDRNEGANPRLWVRRSYSNRAVVAFDSAAIDAFLVDNTLDAATLILNIAENGVNWGRDGRTIDAHPLTKDFAEGNGQNTGVPSSQKTRGDGPGVTWNCATDDEIANQQTNCDPTWDGGAFGPTTAPSVLHTKGLLGEVMWDVTTDVLAGASGWLIKKTQESQQGKVLYYSNEGSASDQPRLVLEGHQTVTVHWVTSLDDVGAGTLRACVEASGPRTCRFEVGGIIVADLPLKVTSSDITIDGSDAPWPGVTVRTGEARDGPALAIATNDVIVRHIRLDAGPRVGRLSTSRDSLYIAPEARNVLVEHTSMRFAVDENLTVRGCDVTVRWSIIAWGLDNGGHTGGPHSKGVLGYNDDPTCGLSLHHNLIAHNNDRNPDLRYAEVQMVNNIIYNPRTEVGEFRVSADGHMGLNFIGNVIGLGPDSKPTNSLPVVNLKPSGAGTFTAYQGDNLVEGSWPLVEQDDIQWFVNAPLPMPSVPTLPVGDVFVTVLADVGASIHRDDVDELLIDNVWSGDGQIIDHPSEVDPDW